MNRPNYIPGYFYKDAWNELSKVFGERMQQEELDLMDSVLVAVTLDERRTADSEKRIVFIEIEIRQPEVEEAMKLLSELNLYQNYTYGRSCSLLLPILAKIKNEIESEDTIKS